MLPLTDAEMADAVRRLLVMARHCFRVNTEPQARSRRYGISRSAFAGSLRNIPEPQGRSPPVGRDRLAVSRSKARALTTSKADCRPLVTSTGANIAHAAAFQNARKKVCENARLFPWDGARKRSGSTFDRGRGNARLDEGTTNSDARLVRD